jgi:hypothetical protein
MVPAPALMAYVKLLALPGAELEQTVADELAQNPALIQDETRTCGTCGIPAEPPCPHCGGQSGLGPRPVGLERQPCSGQLSHQPLAGRRRRLTGQPQPCGNRQHLTPRDVLSWPPHSDDEYNHGARDFVLYGGAGLPGDTSQPDKPG